MNFLVDLGQSEQIEFTSFLVCYENYRVKNKFDSSQPILISISCLIVYICARFGKIYSQDTFFAGIEVNKLYGVYYALLCSVGLIFGTLIIKFTEVSLDVLSAIAGLPAQYFFLAEILSILNSRLNLGLVIYRFVRVRDIIAAVISATLIILWLSLRRPWYLNNLIAICIMGSVLKLFKVTSMKTAIYNLVVMMVFDSVSAVIIHYSVSDLSYDTVIISCVNSPIEMQWPLYNDRTFYKYCTWLPLTGLIFPGIFIEYCNRFDVQRKSFMYTVMGFLGLLGGFFIWMI